LYDFTPIVEEIESRNYTCNTCCLLRNL